MTRNWSNSANYGVSGVWNNTLHAWITSDEQHDKLAAQKGLTRIRSADEFDALDRAKAAKAAELNKDRADLAAYQQALKTMDPGTAYNTVFGQRDLEHAKSAHRSDIMHRFPTARAMDWQRVYKESDASKHTSKTSI